MKKSVVVCSQPRCGSTLLYNIVRFVFEVSGREIELGGYYEQATHIPKDFSGHAVSVFKTHDVRGCEQSAGRVIYIFRNPVRMCVSGIRMFGWTEQHAIEVGLECQPQLEFAQSLGWEVVKYEEYETDPVNFIQKVALITLGTSIAREELEIVLEKVQRLADGAGGLHGEFARLLRQRLGMLNQSSVGRLIPRPLKVLMRKLLPIQYDKVSLVHPGHVTANTLNLEREQRVTEQLQSRLTNFLATNYPEDL